MFRRPSLIDTLHRERKTQKNIAERTGCSQCAVSKHRPSNLAGRKRCGRKKYTSKKDVWSLEKIVKTWPFQERGGFYKEWTQAGVKASRAIAHGPTTKRLQMSHSLILLSHFWIWHNVGSDWLGLRRKRTGLLLNDPKSSSQMKANFAYHLGIKFRK